jgi:uncharacterized Fe-S center protein
MSGKPEVLFASAKPERMERDLTLPAKFQRMLDRMPVADAVKGKTVAIKMHLGGALGYSTIHPLFVHLLVEHVKKGKPKKVFVTDDSVKDIAKRGYTKEAFGAPISSCFGRNGDELVRKMTGWEHLKSVLLGKPIVEADVLINLSHLKGHGDCAFGGACKNLGMGCVPSKTRQKLHSLEGDLVWDGEKCIRCGKCIEECPTDANRFNENGEYEIFWHHCKMCQHCMLACPTGAIKMSNRQFDRFQEGLARVAKLVVDTYKPGNVFHINVLTNITIFCDCWGLTTPYLVPDIGIMASEDIVAVEDASLKAIKTRDLIPGSITPPFQLGKGKHLFEKLHGRDPFVQVNSLEKLGAGTSDYRKVKVK